MSGYRRPSQPTSPLKIILILGAVVVVLGMIVVGGFALWIRSNADELRTAGTNAIAEGQKFGAGRTGQACINEALTRGDTCGTAGILCEVKAKLFLQHCLGAADLPAGFCDGVPARGEILSGSGWLVKQCAGIGRGGDQRCGRLLQAVIDHCGEGGAR